MTLKQTRLGLTWLALMGLSVGCASKDDTAESGPDGCPEGTVDNGEGGVHRR